MAMSLRSQYTFINRYSTCQALQSQDIVARIDILVADSSVIQQNSERHIHSLQRGPPCVRSCPSTSSRKSTFCNEHTGYIASRTFFIASTTCGPYSVDAVSSMRSTIYITWSFCFVSTFMASGPATPIVSSIVRQRLGIAPYIIRGKPHDWDHFSVLACVATARTATLHQNRG